MPVILLHSSKTMRVHAGPSQQPALINQAKQLGVYVQSLSAAKLAACMCYRIQKPRKRTAFGKLGAARQPSNPLLLIHLLVTFTAACKCKHLHPQTAHTQTNIYSFCRGYMACCAPWMESLLTG